jgi:RsiW-degrading membrane proteinase PrsW (M82 family)
MSFQNLVIILLSGVLPTLFWLWFWRREDRLHPEPRRLVAIACLAGAAAVPFAIILEKIILILIIGEKNYSVLTIATQTPWLAIILVTLWATIEEIVKFIAAYTSVLTRPSVDEPIDPVIYLISAALGFAATENVLFLLNTLLKDELVTTILITGNLRFIGAILLHATSSGIIGISLGLSFYKPVKIRRRLIFVGVILSLLLHSLFNLLIIFKNNFGVFSAFLLVWLSVIILLAVLEMVKQIKPKQLINK